MANLNQKVSRKTNTFIFLCLECKLVETLLREDKDVYQIFKIYLYHLTQQFYFHECVKIKTSEVKLQIFIQNDHHKIIFKDNYTKHLKCLE